MNTRYTNNETDIWRKYRDGVDHHNRTGMYSQTERCHRFYEGDQWHGLRAGGEELPVLNFIKPVCKYKIATVAMNSTAIYFSAPGGDARQAAVCDALSRMAATQWERSKMEHKKWSVVKNACIAGDHYVYCYARPQPASVVQSPTPLVEVRLVDKTSLYLADEQNPVLDEQAWMILAERLPVARLREEAEKNGLPKEEIEKIVCDEADETHVGVRSTQEVRTDLGKCTSLLYLEKTPEGLAFCRATRTVVYQPMQVVRGLHRYPVCGMRWEEKLGSARGLSGVAGMVANQIEVNRTVARRAICVKRYSFPTTVYDQDKVLEPEKLGTVGANVAVQNLAGNPIASMVQYLSPVSIGDDAATLQSELIKTSRELEGAGDAATGQVDPTRASGEAIKASRDQAAISLNEQNAAYRQFVEDLALVWSSLWTVYLSDAALVALAGPEQRPFTRSELEAMQPDVRIDVSPVDPFSILARQSSLAGALGGGHITFEEYVQALDDQAGVAKGKLTEILARRKAKGGAQESAGLKGGGAAEVPGNLLHANGAANEKTGGTAGVPGDWTGDWTGAGGDAGADALRQVLALQAVRERLAQGAFTQQADAT